MSAHTPTVKAAKKPLFLPARVVDRLTEASEVAGVVGGVSDFADAILAPIVRDFETGDFHLLLQSYAFDPEDAAEAANDLADLALRRQNEDKLHAEKEVCHE